jgi:predicted transcriptional regulator
MKSEIQTDNIEKSVFLMSIMKKIVDAELSKTDIKVLYQMLENAEIEKNGNFNFHVDINKIAYQLDMQPPNVHRSLKKMHNKIIDWSLNKWNFWIIED